MIDILYKEYKKHKILILTYIALCIIVTFTLGAYVPDITRMHLQAGSLSGGDTLLQLNSSILGEAFNNLGGDYAGVVSISAEPYLALIFLGIVQNINSLANNPLNMPELPVGHPVVLGVVILFFIASKIMKSNSGTKVFGICTLGYLEKFLGTACVLVIGILSVAGVTNWTIGAVADSGAGDVVSSAGGNVFWGILAGLFAVIMAVMSLVVNFIIKTVAKGIDAIGTLFAGIPGLSFGCEVAKSMLVLFLLLINLFFPIAGYILNLLVFAVCCVLFGLCYNANYYFDHIYVFPFFRRMFGLSYNYPIIPKRMPRRLRKTLANANFEPKFVIPVFVTNRVRNCSVKFKRFHKLYLFGDGCSTKLYFKKYGRQKDCIYNMDNIDGRNLYIRKGHRYYEIFTYWNEEKNLAKKNPRKEYSLVFSKDYRGRIDEIIALSGYIDYVAMKEAEKLAKKQQAAAVKEAKRLENEAAKAAKKLQVEAVREERRIQAEENKAERKQKFEEGKEAVMQKVSKLIKRGEKSKS